jgi:hypothetical protein
MLLLLALQLTPVEVDGPCRVHLKGPDGKAVKPPNLPFWRDHFVVPGRVELDLPPGRYAYEVERGPEWTSAAGTFDVPGPLKVELMRIADLAAEGWWSGDLHIHRPPKDVELLMKAEDLRVGPVITWWNAKAVEGDPLRSFDGRLTRAMEGEDEREGGALLYFNLKAPLAITGAKREWPSPVAFLEKAAGAHVDIEKPFWWDVPVWLATGKTHTLGIANNHMCRSTMLDQEAWGKPRDKARLPGPHGNGQWTQEIYYRVLNAGLRVPPSAGSASGVLPNPVGYNRVYVKLDGPLDWDAWWEGLRAGRSFVTNGPLLRVDDRLRGRVDSRDPVKAVELVVNGKVERTAPGPEFEFELPKIERGWYLVRAIADVPHTYRFASTAPRWVGGPRISRAAVRFFLDWIDERAKRIELPEPEREDVLRHHRAAAAFWRNLLERATDD